MKRLISLILITVLSLSCFTSCKKESKSKNNDKITAKSASEETEYISSETETIVEDLCEPSIISIRSICQLATLQCYYHNVCRGTKDPGTGLSHLGESERKFWFEYTAYATLGIDFARVEIVIDGNNITIYYPHAEIIEIFVDPNSVSAPVCEPESFMANSNYITTDDVTAAFASANDEIRNEINSNTALLQSAEFRAEELIRNYINQIMQMSGVEYTISFECIDYIQ